MAAAGFEPTPRTYEGTFNPGGLSIYKHAIGISQTAVDLKQ